MDLTKAHNDLLEGLPTVEAFLLTVESMLYLFCPNYNEYQIAVCFRDDITKVKTALLDYLVSRGETVTDLGKSLLVRTLRVNFIYTPTFPDIRTVEARFPRRTFFLTEENNIVWTNNGLFSTYG